MHTPVADLDLLLSTMEPVLHAGVYVFVSVENIKVIKNVEVFATVREPEGLSAVLRESDAIALVYDLVKMRICSHVVFHHKRIAHFVRYNNAKAVVKSQRAVRYLLLVSAICLDYLICSVCNISYLRRLIISFQEKILKKPNKNKNKIIFCILFID